ncbi:MAG: precorrin-6y C5,15-methyltransferase (decarboxylating) subunit CbiE [Coriobacteriales bacterium]|jgi:precorrin-6Y C5,15-methyltransferase (decarboxylating)
MGMIGVSIVGIGMGVPGSETVRAREAICGADVLGGARRMIDAAQAIRAAQGAGEAEAVELGMPAKVAAFIIDCAARNEGRPDPLGIAVICSGDTGFYSLATPLREELRSSGFEQDIEMIPGITTVQHLAAKLGKPWQDCRLVSAHGRTVNVVGEVLSSPETFFLGGGTEMPDSIARRLVDAGLGFVDMAVGVNLSYPDELIVRGTADEIAQTEFSPLAAVWVSRGRLCAPEVEECVGFPGIPDDLFLRGDVPMTKRDVRAAIAARVRPRDNERIVDIGAGTGSVSIELACLNPRAYVVAVEENHGACELIRANRERFGAYNVEVVEGRAPEALGPMPVADTVFIGGSTGELESILDAYASNSGCRRIIMTAVTLETLARATTALERLRGQGCVESYDVTEVSVARTRELGSHHLLRAENPVFIIEASVRVVIM